MHENHENLRWKAYKKFWIKMVNWVWKDGEIVEENGKSGKNTKIFQLCMREFRIDSIVWNIFKLIHCSKISDNRKKHLDLMTIMVN